MKNIYPTVSLLARLWNETETPRNQRRLQMTCHFDLCNYITLANKKTLLIFSFLFSPHQVGMWSNCKQWILRRQKKLLKLSYLVFIWALKETEMNTFHGSLSPLNVSIQENKEVKQSVSKIWCFLTPCHSDWIMINYSQACFIYFKNKRNLLTV